MKSPWIYVGLGLFFYALIILMGWGALSFVALTTNPMEWVALLRLIAVLYAGFFLRVIYLTVVEAYEDAQK